MPCHTCTKFTLKLCLLKMVTIQYSEFCFTALAIHVHVLIMTGSSFLLSIKVLKWKKIAMKNCSFQKCTVANLMLWPPHWELVRHEMLCAFFFSFTSLFCKVMKLALILSNNFISNCFKGYLHDGGRLILTRFEEYLVALSKVEFSSCDDSSLPSGSFFCKIISETTCTFCSCSCETVQDVLMPRNLKEFYFFYKALFKE